MGAVRRELRWLSWGGDWSFRLASRSVMLGWGGQAQRKVGRCHWAWQWRGAHRLCDVADASSGEERAGPAHSDAKQEKTGLVDKQGWANEQGFPLVSERLVQAGPVVVLADADRVPEVAQTRMSR